MGSKNIIIPVVVLSLNCVYGTKDRFFASTAQGWREAFSSRLKQRVRVVYMQTQTRSCRTFDINTNIFIYFGGIGLKQKQNMYTKKHFLFTLVVLLHLCVLVEP